MPLEIGPIDLKSVIRVIFNTDFCQALIGNLQVALPLS